MRIIDPALRQDVRTGRADLKNKNRPTLLSQPQEAAFIQRVMG
jgi:hypothetical protein